MGALEYDAKQPASPLAIRGLQARGKEFARRHGKRSVENTGITAVDIDIDRIAGRIGDECGVESELRNAKGDVIVLRENDDVRKASP
jgi:hypothetical protein